MKDIKELVIEEIKKMVEEQATTDPEMVPYMHLATATLNIAKSVRGKKVNEIAERLAKDMAPDTANKFWDTLYFINKSLMRLYESESTNESIKEQSRSQDQKSIAIQNVNKQIRLLKLLKATVEQIKMPAEFDKMAEEIKKANSVKFFEQFLHVKNDIPVKVEAILSNPLEVITAVIDEVINVALRNARGKLQENEIKFPKDFVKKHKDKEAKKKGNQIPVPNLEEEIISEKEIDMMGKKCQKCKKGKYKETSMHDDMDGVLHCDKCRHEVPRHGEEWAKKEIEKKEKRIQLKHDKRELLQMIDNMIDSGVSVEDIKRKLQ